MTTELLVASLSGAVSLLAAGLAIWAQFRLRRMQRDRETSRYREPLAFAAHELQSRLYNILKQDFIRYFLAESESERERSYVVDNTLFLFAQYLGWTELIRRDIQFIDLERHKATRAVSKALDRVRRTLGTDRFHPCLRVFAGEQRAVGEAMTDEAAGMPVCMGYLAFLEWLQDSRNTLIEALRSDVRALEADLDDARPRLVELQHGLVDLIDILDPHFVRFEANERTKV